MADDPREHLELALTAADKELSTALGGTGLSGAIRIKKRHAANNLLSSNSSLYQIIESRLLETISHASAQSRKYLRIFPLFDGRVLPAVLVYLSIGNNS